MTNLNYVHGRQLEYRTAKWLERHGWHTKRAPASKGVYDVFAIQPLSTLDMTLPKPDQKWEVRPRVLFIQCKRMKRVPKIGFEKCFARDRTELVAFARPFGAEAAFATQVGRKAWLEWLLPESHSVETI